MEKNPLPPTLARADVERALAKAQHDLNNPLACVTANLDYAIEALGAHLDAATLAEIVTALREAGQAAQQLKTTVEALREIVNRPLADD